ncbi:hypothetical protein PAHAL_1G285300 [Panicum hallii]|jgi:hypothetical protein|uniref:SMP domain-containing protein n=1 Tax=Panicum hallii TaxID=206008 RepID=A0A2S3GQX2_9POAL|nr:late embryogenesis abundant protein 3-like [Panicum hallii]PAN06742.1 hypothetical protein PAHAL_1G285300 [Panicum hallii]
MSHAKRGRPSDDVDDDACREEREEPAATETVTVGQALQAVALSPAGGRPVDRADASAVEAAERSATGLGRAVPGGVAAAAQRAKEANEHGDAVTTVRDVLGDAAAVTPGDRAATWVDAEKVAAATGRGGGGMGEVADAVAAAAQINQGSTLEL